MNMLDDTHDPSRTSWVASANAADTDFPLQNLPYGVFRLAGTGDAWRIGVAIGDQVLDLPAALDAGSSLPAALREPDLNTFMASDAAVRVAARRTLSAALTEGSAQQAALQGCLVPTADIEMARPCRIGGYTDFYAGIHHALTVGRLFRPDNPLLPNYKWVPIGYHGRTSTIAVSGQRVVRPAGQTAGADGRPTFGPCKRLDYELEVGLLIGPGNAEGEPIPIDRAEAHAFGLVLLNDWSARDIQAWEYQPLGPFLAKNFATTISPWVVTMEALAPFRAAFTRPEGDPQPLPYLDGDGNRASGAIDLTLEVWLQTAAMAAPERLMSSNLLHAYWTMAQFIAHHTSNGCSLQPGDLLGSGTISGPDPKQGGSLLELSQGGKQPITLPSGETRTFLQDGDTVILRAYAERDGARRIGFGECRGRVLPSRLSM